VLVLHVVEVSHFAIFQLVRRKRQRRKTHPEMMHHTSLTITTKSFPLCRPSSLLSCAVFLLLLGLFGSSNISFSLLRHAVEASTANTNNQRHTVERKRGGSPFFPRINHGVICPGSAPTSKSKKNPQKSHLNDTSFVPSTRNSNGTEVYYMTAETPERMDEHHHHVDQQQQQEEVEAKQTSTTRTGKSFLSKLRLTISRDNHDSLYHASIVVGVASAAVGSLYVNVLSKCRHFLWTSLPNMLFSSSSSSSSSSSWLAVLHKHPALFIVIMTTLGGLLLGCLSATPTLVGNTPTYTASDFVSICSNKYYHDQQPQPSGSAGSAIPTTTTVNSTLLPSAKKHLLSLLGMCLLTSAFGIPLGPEA
jgi:hypothetical protein